MDDVFFTPADDEHVQREKRRAQELRRSQWWKNRRATGRCHYCQGQFPARQLTMDHVVPVIRGGRSTRANVVPCCPECNARKKYLLPLEWEAYLEDLRQRSA
jgi:5-methylcytosine-specific restriction endonuclease McrA